MKARPYTLYFTLGGWVKARPSSIGGGSRQEEADGSRRSTQQLDAGYTSCRVQTERREPRGLTAPPASPRYTKALHYNRPSHAMPCHTILLLILYYTAPVRHTPCPAKAPCASAADCGHGAAHAPAPFLADAAVAKQLPTGSRLQPGLSWLIEGMLQVHLLKGVAKHLLT